MSDMKMSDAPKGATHWQPKTEFIRECFYKKVPSGVSTYIVAPEDDRCNQWCSNDGRGETSVIEVLPIVLINNHDRMVEEIAELKGLLVDINEWFKDEFIFDGEGNSSIEQLLAKLQKGEG